MRKNMMTIIGMLMLAACNSASVNWTYPRAPAEGVLPNVGTLGVLPFQGERGQQAAALLAQGLDQAGLYDVVDGSTFESLANSVYLGKRLADVSGDRDDAIAEFLGKTDAVLTGRVTTLEVRDRIESHQSTSPDPNELPRDSVRRVTYCTLGLLVEVRAVPGGEIIFQREYVDKEMTSTRLCDHIRDIPPMSRSEDNALKARVISSVVAEIKSRLTPTLQRVDFRLYSDKKVPGSQEAVALAQAGDWADALQKFDEIAKTHQPLETGKEIPCARRLLQGRSPGGAVAPGGCQGSLHGGQPHQCHCGVPQRHRHRHAYRPHRPPGSGASAGNPKRYR